MKLERWIRHHDVLVGYSFGNPKFKDGTRVATNYCPAVYDGKKQEFFTGGIVHCSLDEDWKLGDPGTYFEHDLELPGGKWKPSIFQRAKNLILTG